MIYFLIGCFFGFGWGIIFYRWYAPKITKQLDNARKDADKAITEGKQQLEEGYRLIEEQKKYLHINH